MERLTIDTKIIFCDIAQCREMPGGSFCADGYCDQRRVYERLREYERIGLAPEEIMVKDDILMCAAIVLGTSIDHIRDLLAAEKEGRAVVLPCKVGDTVYIAASCEEICMHVDDAYENGTGATECPFENTCDIEECDDSHIRIFETKCAGFMLDENGTMLTFFDGLSLENACTCWGKTAFFTRAEAEAALKGAVDNEAN